MKQTKPKLVLIGAGNLAVHLGKALQKAGYSIKQVYSRTEEAARSLAGLLNTVWTNQLEELTCEASVYIVALKDTALVELTKHIAGIQPKAIFVHTAGSIPMSIWENNAQHYGVFYPMQTFSKEREVNMMHVPIFLEASDYETLATLHTIAESISSNVYELSSEQRRYLHLGAVLACNFTNHLYTLTAKLLKTHHIPFEVMLPLIDETAAKIHNLPPAKAQTGPAVRYDKNVIESHLTLLADDPQLQELYRLLSLSIHKHHTQP